MHQSIGRDVQDRVQRCAVACSVVVGIDEVDFADSGKREVLDCFGDDGVRGELRVPCDDANRREDAATTRFAVSGGLTAVAIVIEVLMM